MRVFTKPNFDDSATPAARRGPFAFWAAMDALSALAPVVLALRVLSTAFPHVSLGHAFAQSWHAAGFANLAWAVTWIAALIWAAPRLIRSAIHVVRAVRGSRVPVRKGSLADRLGKDADPKTALILPLFLKGVVVAPIVAVLLMNHGVVHALWQAAVMGAPWGAIDQEVLGALAFGFFMAACFDGLVRLLARGLLGGAYGTATYLEDPALFDSFGNGLWVELDYTDPLSL